MKKARPKIEQSAQDTSDCSAYALSNFLLLTPRVPITATGEVDYLAADPALLVQLADAADSSLLLIHISTSAIGRLLAQAATAAFSQEHGADNVEAIGWLVAELIDVAATAHKISAACRRLTYDYAPPDGDTTIPLVRP
jgi:hypothetical protein